MNFIGIILSQYFLMVVLAQPQETSPGQFSGGAPIFTTWKGKADIGREGTGEISAIQVSEVRQNQDINNRYTRRKQWVMFMLAEGKWIVKVICHATGYWSSVIQ